MIRDLIIRGVRSPFVRARRILRGEAAGAAGLNQDFWALNDVSFDIYRGEVVGIIGRNGAGKSTLLKLLSRVTEPTTGYADIYGRVGALLEVGTGFHDELSGRENVYLNGAILGMTRKEIERRFDEIVDFAEVEKFIDTPVKHFSSGMRLRLAFSVAAFLDPEILIIDEVLAVGDASFRQKCLNRMEGVGEEGRTVLFVSHNMPAVTRLCERVILLDGGKVVDDGPAHVVVPSYLNADHGSLAEQNWLENPPGDDVIRLNSVRVSTENSRVSSVVDVTQPVTLEMDYEICEPGHQFLLLFELFDEAGTSIFATGTSENGHQRPTDVGIYTSKVQIPELLLQEGTIHVTADLRTLNPMVIRTRISDAVSFQVIVDGTDPDPARAAHGKKWTGIVRPMLKWTTEPSTE